MGKFYSRIFLGLLILCTALSSKAQVSNYGFTALGGTYTSITGTSPTLTGSTDEGYANNISLGFNFVFNGITYTSVGVSTNGFISFGTLTSASFTNNLATGTNGRPLVAPLWDDHDISAATNIQYTTTGSSGSRIFTMQWTNVLWNYQATAPVISFQVRLYEGTNVIEFVYNNLAGTPNLASASIGLSAVATGAGNYLSLNGTGTAPGTSSTTETTTISAKPATGQIYRFTPPVACSGTPSAGTASATPASACYGASVQLALTGATTGASGITYQWQSSPDGSTWTNIPGATATSLTVVPTRATQYRAIVTCSNSSTSATSNAVPVTVTTPSYASIPYFQGFETWASACGTNDRPDASWGLIPVTSDSAWRRDDQGSTANWTSNSGGYTPVFSEGAHSARFHTYNTTSGNSGIMDFFVNLSTITGTKQIKFDYINTTGNDSLVVLLSNDGGNTFTRLDSLRLRAAWTSKTIPITSNSATAVIRLKAVSDFGFTDIGVDNFFILTPCNGTPAAGTVSSSASGFICAGNSFTLTLSGQSPASGIAIQWQSSPDNTVWTDIGGATGTTYTGTASTTTYYRAKVTCTNTSSVAFTSSVLINVNNPQVTSTVPVTRCGPGSVPLFATASTGATLRWYTAGTGGVPVGTGPVFNTPIISTNTNYYVSATQGGGSSNVGLSPTATTCGTIAASSLTDWPLRFNTTSAVTINSAYVIPQAAGDLVVALRSSLSSTDIQTATFTFTTAQVGQPQQITLNFVVSTPGSYQLTNTSGGVYRISTFTCAYPFTSAAGNFSIVGSATTSTSATNTTTYNSFYQLNVTESCESPRTAVVAGISPAPAFSVTPVTSVCNNGIRMLAVTSNTANFNTYVWSPTAGLYTDAAATIPYTGTSATTVYAKNSAPGVYTYIATANNITSSCQNIDSVKVTVLPASISITSSVPQICTSGSATLTLVPSTGYAPASVQWYSSTDGGTTYTAISGATSATYTTPAIGATTTYKAVVTDGSGSTCLQPTITVNVSSPQVLTTTPGARCGPGTVTLQATSSTGTTINWYTAATGGYLAGTGPSFTTPSLNATTTYYVTAFAPTASGAAGRTAPLDASTGFAADDYGLVFNATQAFTLRSVDIYSSSTTAGSITVQLLNSSGTVLQTAGPFVVPVRTGATVATGATPTTLLLGFDIAPGTGYRLRSFNHTGNIIRDNPIGTSFTYPLAIGTLGSITGAWTAGAASTSSYYYFYNLQYAAGCASARTAVVATVSGNTAIAAQPSNIATCAGSTITFSVTASGANLTYQWRKGGVNISGATSSTYTINATTVADAGNYDVVVTGLCGTQTSTVASLTVSSTNSWLGAVSADWNNAANWCGGVPTEISDVVIGTGTPFQPTISSLGTVHNITLNAGATLTVTPSSFLNIYGNYSGSGTLAAPSAIVGFRGTASQNIGTISAGTFLVNGAGVSLSGTMTVGTTLILTSGNISLGANNLVLNGSVNGSATSHIITDGTGGVISNNVNAAAVTVPVGPDATHYNPVIISNGQGRNYTVKVVTGIVPAAILNNNRAINRTWTVTPSTAPSSPVNLVFQYADGDENSNAIPTLLMEVGAYNGTQWNVISPATGVTPSGVSTARQVGITTIQFGPIVISNIGGLTTPLALRNVDADVSRVVLMPNLVNSQAVLRVEARRSMKIIWSVVDAHGRVVMMFSKQVMAGQNDQTLDLGHLAGGIYQLVGDTGKGKTSVIRFIKQ